MSCDDEAQLRKRVAHLWGEASHFLEGSMYIAPRLMDEHGGRRGIPRIRLWRNAGGFCEFGPCSITVFQSFAFEKRATPFMRKVEWQKSHDLQLLRHSINDSSQEIEPTFVVQ